VTSDLESLIVARAERASLSVPAETVSRLAQYLDLLARWNRRINLTAFNLDRLGGDAIDRLIVEPLEAAPAIAAEDRLAVDIGSGGGSPALPLKIALPRLQMALIESRERKAAFLREAVRQLGLDRVAVETARAGSDGLPLWNGRADVVTMRAVRADGTMWQAVERLLRPGGRLFWFRGAGESAGEQAPGGWTFDALALVDGAELAIGRRQG
jgi:16S rRNA (guanine527-N7)-methyltransferase